MSSNSNPKKRRHNKCCTFYFYCSDDTELILSFKILYTYIFNYLCTGGAYYVRVPYSCLLISNKFCNRGEWTEQGAQVPLYTCSSTPLSMGPETSLWALVQKTTYATMIYAALCIMFWMRASPLLGQVGGGCINHRCINSYNVPLILKNL